MRKMEVVLPDDNVRAVATFLEDEAPKTCEAVWNALPLAGRLWHGMFSGQESFLRMRGPGMIRVGPENQVWHVIPGDVAYWYSWEEGKGRWKDVGEYSEVIIIYGRYASVRDFSMRVTPVNLFARVTENLEGYARAAAKIREVGLKRVEFRKCAE
ncbi:MAG: DUF3830 family protein [Candidatus Bathyarchaeia archaeon]